jgi:parallel beta-helix repeat protein
MTTRTQRSSTRWAALGLLLGGLGVAAGPAEAVTLIPNCPYTIMQPGVYVLASDLTCPGPAITITADNVVLNLNGNTLTSDSGGGDGVLAEGTDANPTLEGLRVENGTVAGFSDGILLDNTPGARVTSVVAQGNADAGIEVDGCAGCQFLGNRLNGNGYGIYAVDCADCRIAGNHANDSDSDGITILGTSPRFRIESNTANGNEDGIDLQDAGTGAENGRIVGNTTNNNTDNGIDVFAGWTGNRIEGNRATGNSNPDLNDDNLPDCVNTWRGNRFVTDNEGDGPSAGCIQ